MHKLIGSLKRSSLTALLQLNLVFPFFSPTFFSLFSAGEVVSTPTDAGIAWLKPQFHCGALGKFLNLNFHILICKMSQIFCEDRDL